MSYAFGARFLTPFWRTGSSIGNLAFNIESEDVQTSSCRTVAEVENRVAGRVPIAECRYAKPRVKPLHAPTLRTSLINIYDIASVARLKIDLFM